MPLHRDIFWIGRQWAVTGHGMQLIDQRLEGAFDIEAVRLWDDDLIESWRAKAWLKAEDFEKGLAVARTRHSQASGTMPAQAAAQVPMPEPIAPSLSVAKLDASQCETAKPKVSVAVQPDQPSGQPVPENPPPVTIDAPRQEAAGLQMRTVGGAKFARPWRVWMKKS